MIEIKIGKTNGCITFIEVSGHSGYSQEGSDIVCAAVSSVLWSTINGLEALLGLPLKYHEKEGFAHCRIPELTGVQSEKAQVLTGSMELFFRQMQGQYSEYITITEV